MKLPPSFNFVKHDELRADSRRIAAALSAESIRVTKLLTALRAIVALDPCPAVRKIAEEALKP